VTDARAARKTVEERCFGEMLADETEAPFGMELLAIERDDAGSLLAAMLQGMQSENREGGGIRVIEDTEDAAFLPELVVDGPLQ
jgi:hypothetical protein